MTRQAAEDHLQVPPLTKGAQRIVEVASDLFYERGIHAVGVDTIAAESGVTKRTLYDRFGSKDTLVVVYLQARHRTWWARMEQRVAESEPPAVMALFDAYVEDAPATGRGCAFLNAAGELPKGHPAHEVVRAHKLVVRDRIADLVRTDVPDADDPDAIADHVFLLLEGAISHMGIEGDERLFAAARSAAAIVVRSTTAEARRPRGKATLDV